MLIDQSTPPNNVMQVEPIFELKKINGLYILFVPCSLIRIVIPPVCTTKFNENDLWILYFGFLPCGSYFGLFTCDSFVPFLYGIV